jgi:hypothetical protein
MRTLVLPIDTKIAKRGCEDAPLSPNMIGMGEMKAKPCLQKLQENRRIDGDRMDAVERGD